MPHRRPGSYLDIQKWVQQHYGFTPENAWIAHCKELYGLPVKSAGRSYRPRERQCPPERRIAIYQAFVNFGLLPKQ